MDWGLRSSVDYQEDYWIKDSGALQVIWLEMLRIFLQGLKVNTANGTSIPMACKGKMNVEAIPKQDKSSKGVLTTKVSKGMLHRRCMGQRRKW